ncbi:hypothetical protein [Prauserella aidingensis]|uniref:hypothetical protein n=1 Tax=Prauserella aidingensis TaxID=387890 RepID=UPI0020A28A28|nr:hypothetical protein [Prauserella aidingensis]
MLVVLLFMTRRNAVDMTHAMTPTDAAPRDAARSKIYTTWFRCAVDGRDHAVEDEAFAAGRASGGRCVAVCGHVVEMSAAIVPNGPVCRGCAAVLAPVVPVPHCGRGVRPGLVRRLVGRRGMEVGA